MAGGVRGGWKGRARRRGWRGGEGVETPQPITHLASQCSCLYDASTSQQLEHGHASGSSTLHLTDTHAPRQPRRYPWDPERAVDLRTSSTPGQTVRKFGREKKGGGFSVVPRKLSASPLD